MNKSKNILYIMTLGIILISIMFQGCSENEADVFSSGRSLYFLRIGINPETNVRERVDTASFSFSHHVGMTEYTHEFTVCLIGDTLTSDLEYKVMVVDDETTAKEGQYTLPEKLLFHTGDVEDVLPLTIYKDKLQDGEEVVLCLRLVANENFGIGYSAIGDEYTDVKLWFNNRVSKPLWWKDDIELAIFGTYSYKKFETITAANPDFTTADGLSLSELRKVALATKEYIKLHGITEEDGSPMEIPMY